MITCSTCPLHPGPHQPEITFRWTIFSLMFRTDSVGAAGSRDSPRHIGHDRTRGCRRDLLARKNAKKLTDQTRRRLAFCLICMMSPKAGSPGLLAQAEAGHRNPESSP